MEQGPDWVSLLESPAMTFSDFEIRDLYSSTLDMLGKYEPYLVTVWAPRASRALSDS